MNIHIYKHFMDKTQDKPNNNNNNKNNNNKLEQS